VVLLRTVSSKDRSPTRQSIFNCNCLLEFCPPLPLTTTAGSVICYIIAQQCFSDNRRSEESKPATPTHCTTVQYCAVGPEPSLLPASQPCLTSMRHYLQKAHGRLFTSAIHRSLPAPDHIVFWDYGPRDLQVCSFSRDISWVRYQRTNAASGFGQSAR
jgi:hypothetical protein